MKKSDRNALLAVVVIGLVGAGIAWAGSQGGATVAGIPVFALCVGLAFLIQWLAFIPAYLLQSERFFDLTGSITYISVTAIAVLLSPVVDGRSILLLGLVVIWAARLGIFLFRRIRKAGKDPRFDELKTSFSRFLMTWTLQGLWVTLTLAAALAAITTTVAERLGSACAGWLCGVVGRDCVRGNGRRPEKPLPGGSGEQGQIHRYRSVGLVPPPQLLWRDRALDRRGRNRPARLAGLAVGHPDLPGICGAVTDPHQWRAHAGEKGRRKMGRPGGL